MAKIHSIEYRLWGIFNDWGISQCCFCILVGIGPNCLDVGPRKCVAVKAGCSGMARPSGTDPDRRRMLSRPESPDITFLA